MKPALTKEEWERLRFPKPQQPGGMVHGVAATHLHNQPFGFTREDVELLRTQAEYCREMEAEKGDGAWAARMPKSFVQMAEEYAFLADRIEALLPPEEQ